MRNPTIFQKMLTQYIKPGRPKGIVSLTHLRRRNLTKEIQVEFKLLKNQEV